MSTASTRPANALDDLRRINARFVHNFVTNDVAAHERLLHPAFVTLQGDGSVLDRAAYLAQWATGFSPEAIPYWDARGEHITVLDDVALVRAVNQFVVVADGQDVLRAARYTDTYVRAGDRWLCVQAQITPVPPQHVPPEDTIVNLYVRGVKQRGIEPADV